MGEKTVVDEDSGILRHEADISPCWDDSPDDGAEIDPMGNPLARFGVRLQDTPAKDYPPRWQDCEDLEVWDEWGQLVWAGPRYLRCTRVECHMLVTHGMIAQGGCWCGNRRLAVALRLTKEEAAHLKAGYYPLLQWEAEQIQSTLPPGKAPGWGKAEDAEHYA